MVKLNGALTSVLQATYIGGSGTDLANAITNDSSGNLYVAGQTSSANFPGTTGGAQSKESGANDGFVVKLNGGLTSIVQATYIGKKGSSVISAIAVDKTGNV